LDLRRKKKYSEQMRDLSFLTVLVLKIRVFWKEYWKRDCHFKFGIFTDCVENFSTLDEKKVFQTNARFEFSHSFDFEDSGLLEGIYSSLSFRSHGTRVSRFSHPSRTSQPFKIKAKCSFEMSVINYPPPQRNNPDTLNPILVSVELLSAICCSALQRRSSKVLHISCDCETLFILWGTKIVISTRSVVERNALFTARQILRDCQYLSYPRN
jgi:hypothetical protein